MRWSSQVSLGRKLRGSALATLLCRGGNNPDWKIVMLLVLISSRHGTGLSVTVMILFLEDPIELAQVSRAKSIIIVQQDIERLRRGGKEQSRCGEN